jgi:hypothetical protein
MPAASGTIRIVDEAIAAVRERSIRLGGPEPRRALLQLTSSRISPSS